ncbi:hypothetical protein WMY93_028627 [Mugilogobius chulae]|uniref:Ig-like domain-containing protein n=1 Tax=Mugilogobius chulae TaxID=88201 RepID=A0AAW0N155_9GOBI
MCEAVLDLLSVFPLQIPNYEMFILKWEVVQDNKATTVATFYSAMNQVDISPNYEGRAFLDVNSSERKSVLSLTKVTMEDNGNYQCSVMIPGDDEGTPSALTFILVLEEGALSLFNISREMSGFYVCTSTNRIGSASCNFTLAVMPGGSMSGATAGIIGGVVGAVLLLAVLIFCCCRHKKKKAKYTEGSPAEMEFRDRDDADGYQDNKTSHDDKDINEQAPQFVKTEIDKLDEDLHSTAESHKYTGSRDRLDNYRDSHDRADNYNDNRERTDNYHGSRDRLDDYHDNQHRQDNYRGSRDRLDDYHDNQNRQDNYRGSRDRLDDYRGSRDRLDDYRGSRDRLDDHRSSQDRLDDHRGSRDRLDDHRGSRDRLDDHRGNRARVDNYYGSRDRLDDHRGSRDCLDDGSHRYGSRDHLNFSERGRFE